MITLTGACLGTIVVLDVLFALDSSIVVSVTTTTFIVVTSNVLATIAVRSWVCMRETTESIRFPRIAIPVLMAVVAAKLLTQPHVRVPPATWLIVIAAIGCAGVVESIVATRLRDGSR
jgi:predicted tellurium resistance membrane protein TerC